MSIKNYLDETGLLYFLVKIKNFISSNYVAKDGNKVLSTNDFTNNDKSKLDIIEAGATRTEIDDTTFTTRTVWSSSKVNTELSGKQDVLTAGSNIDITGNIISATGLLEIDDTTTSSSSAWSSSKVNTELSDKQDVLTAGDRISITNNEISASSEINDASSSLSSSYSSNKVDTLLSGKQNTLTPGTNISIENDVISVSGAVNIDDTTTSTSSTWSSSKINTELASKQNVLTAGTRVSISDQNVISVSTEINDSATTNSNTWSANKIASVIAAIDSLTYAVVQTLPTTDISTTTIYLLPKTTAQTNNVYDEYMYINNVWEKIGTTEVDLSGYVKESDLVPISNQDIDAMFE